jgi:3-oxoacyl-(acyl-carrier-protein) synthase
MSPLHAVLRARWLSSRRPGATWFATRACSARPARAALRDARLSPDDIGHVNAHGTATKLNDAIETLAIKRVFRITRDAWRCRRRSR